MPFAIFPLELWDLILDWLDDSEDIENVFSALPALVAPLHAKKTSWLFQQVFPHIFKYIAVTPKDILSLRQVSRRWCNVIDKFLEDHPSRHPYNPTGTHRRSVKYREFVYEEVDFPCIRIKSRDDIEKWLEHFNDGYPRDPFLGRAVIKIGNPVAFEGVHRRDEMEIFLRTTLNFLQIHGHCIQHVELHLGTHFSRRPEYPAGEGFFKTILKFLEYLPNLRSLGIAFSIYGPDMAAKFSVTYPPLPFLQSFSILPGMQYRSQSLDLLIRAYCGKGSIKKLELHAEDWQKKFRPHFQNLTQLALRNYESGVHSAGLKGILRDVGGPNLKRVQLWTPVSNDEINEILIILTCVKVQVEELEIFHVDIPRFPRGTVNVRNGGGRMIRKYTPLSSIRYLRIGNCQNLCFDFLRVLPSLQNIRLDINLKVIEHAQLAEGLKLDFESGKQLSLTRMIQSYMVGKAVPENVNIWNELSTLRLLTVVVDGRNKIQFSREMGNKFIRISEMSTD